MREEFSAYRCVDKQKLRKLWSTATFSFDASTLLNLYESEAETTAQFLSILENLKDRIWLAHQAGREFYENRGVVIARGRKVLGQIEEISKTSPNFLRSSAAEKVRKILEGEAEHLQSFLDKDPIESRLNTLFKGKLGKPYPRLHQKYVQAEQRFKLKIPPGFRDETKQDYKKYGDVILWFQLLDHAADARTNLIFVTAEAKTDWWLSGEQKKRLGPRPELAQEMKDRAGVEFHMYSPTEFVKHSDDLIGMKSKPAKVKQALQDLQRIEKQKEAPALSLVPTDWLVNPSPNFIYGGDSLSLSPRRGGSSIPGVMLNQMYTPGLFPDSGAGYTFYPAVFDPTSRLFDAAGNVLAPSRPEVFYSTNTTQTGTPPLPEQSLEKQQKKEKESDQELGTKAGEK
jgi:hypothetical protein